MANIWIEGHGVFSLGNEKVQDLISWLASNQAVQSEGTSKQFEGQQLLNETGDTGSKPKMVKGAKPANVGNPKPVEGKDYDFGGTWL